jgi:NAD(P)-dependent dehydrogenase (short-subunit alcohol dehydrogenase family)
MMIAPLNPPIPDWAGLRVWIIGASSGIGAETARQLARRGARLALSARRAALLESVRQQFPAQAHDASLILPLDIVDRPAVAEASQTLVERWGGIDLVLVAAGQYDGVRAEDFGPRLADRVESVLGVNLLGTYHVLSAALPVLRQQGRGTLAIISSVAGYNGLPRALAYAPSKAALNNLCEGLFFELRPLGIGVVRICPGFVATPMTARIGFRMPALVTVETAATEIIHGLEQGHFEIHFPQRFTRLLKVLQWLPRRLYFFLLRRGANRA